MKNLETCRLILRPFEKDDLEDLYEYINAQTVHCFLNMHFRDIKEAKKELVSRIKDKTDYLAIEEKATGKVIGEIFAHPEAVDPEEHNLDTYSPCWMLNPLYQGKGYAYEAIKAYFSFLFDVKNARRIYIYTEEDNYSCQKLCEKIGMRKEGVFKEFVSFIKTDDGTPIYENTLQYAILKAEWLKKCGD